MKVKELIEKLKTLDQEKEINIRVYYGILSLGDIETIKNKDSYCLTGDKKL